MNVVFVPVRPPSVFTLSHLTSSFAEVIVTPATRGRRCLLVFDDHPCEYKITGGSEAGDVSSRIT